MAELNKLQPSFIGYGIGKDLGDDALNIISRATPDNQKPPGTLGKNIPRVI